MPPTRTGLTGGSRPPAVVIGGSANAVSVARSLDGAGVEVYAIGRRTSPVRFSRHCRRFVTVDHDADVQAAWLEWLERGPEGAVLLPCDDDALELIARNRARLVGLGYRPFEANDDVLLTMLDKSTTYRLARDAGLDTPETHVPRDSDELDDALEHVSFPCAVKPVHSHLFQQRATSPVKAIVAGSAAELREAYALMRASGVEALITEIIPGGDDQLCSYYGYLEPDGTSSLHLTKRKIRQYPNGFGLGCYQITDWNPEVAALGLRFFQAMGVRGLANVEFKRDARDGRLKLIECNHRFTAANEQLRVAGIDLALFTYARLAGIPSPQVDSYRSDVRLWHPIEDARAFLSYRARGELTLSEWATSLLHVQHFPLFRWDDPGPSVASNWWLAQRAVRRGGDSLSAPKRHLQPRKRRAVPAAEGELSTKIIGDLDELESLRPEWTRLADKRGNAFVSPEWFFAWVSVKPDVRPFVPVVRGADGAVVGLLPLVLTGGPGPRVVRFSGASVGDRFQPVCAEQHDDIVAACARRALEERRDEWTMIVLHNVDDDATWPRRLVRPAFPGLSATWDDRKTLPFAGLEGVSGWDDFLQARSRNFRSQLGRKLRAIERDHEVAFRRVSDPGELPAAIDTFFRLHDLRWGERGGSSLPVGIAREFHHRFAAASLAADRLRLWFMDIDGETVGGWYGWSFGGRYAYYLAGFDPSWARHSVGLLLLARTMRDAIEEGAVEYDMLLGDEEYKRRFADRERLVRTMVATPSLHPLHALAGADVGLRKLARRLPPVAQDRLRGVASGVLHHLPSARHRQ